MSTLSKDDIAERVRATIHEHMGCDEVTYADDNKNMYDCFGCDDLDNLEIMMSLEESFSVQIPDDDYDTISDFVNTIHTQLQEKANEIH